MEKEYSKGCMLSISKIDAISEPLHIWTSQPLSCRQLTYIIYKFCQLPTA